MKFERSALIFFAALAAALGVSLYILAPCPVWITDNGNKYIIMRNYAAYGTAALRHAEPELAPTGDFHIQHHEKQLRSFYPEFYPVLCSFFYLAGGECAAALPAILGTLVCAFTVFLWTKNKLLAAVTVLCTALLFYSFVLWEMTLSCAVVTCALYLLLKKRHAFFAGLLIGLGLFLREESYFAAAALGFALLIFKEYKALAYFAAGTVCGVLPVWIYNYVEFGNILGLHGKVYLAGTGIQSVAGIAWNYFHHLLRGEPTGRNLEILYTIVPAILMIISSFKRKTKLRAIALTFASAGAAILLLRYIRLSGYSYAAACSTGVFAALPVGWFFFSDIRNALTRQAKIYRILALFVLVYIVTVPAVLTRGDVGLIWSARHFMVLIPALVILSAKSVKNIDLPTARETLPAVAALLALGQQLAGVYSLRQISNECRELENVIRQMKTPIVASDVFYLPEMTPRLWFENLMLDISKSSNVEKISQSAPGEMLLVISPNPQFRRIGDNNMSYLLKNYDIPAAPVHFKKSSGTGFIDLFIFKLIRKGGAK